MMKNLVCLLCKFFREHFNIPGNALKSKLLLENRRRWSESDKWFHKHHLTIILKFLICPYETFRAIFKHSSGEYGAKLILQKTFKFKRKMNNASLGKKQSSIVVHSFFCQASIFMVLQTIRHKRKKKFTSSLTLQSLVCLHCRVFLLCPPLHDSGFIDNVKCFTMCVQIKLIRHRKKRHVEEQKKIAKDVAAM